jgi:xanthine dehydrogenase accessory factor
MRELYEAIMEILDRGDHGVLATVIRQEGSAPRTRGAQMLVRQDGSSVGSIGGGTLEAEVLERAAHLVVDVVPEILHFDLTGTEIAQTEMLCGGEVDVFLEPISPRDPSLRPLYHALLELKNTAGKAVVVTRIGVPDSEPWGSKALVHPDGATQGSLTLPDEVRTAAMEVLEHGAHGLVSRGREQFYLEPVVSEPTLYIFGAGHISRHLASLATMLEFTVVVIDDRAEFANREDFPDVDRLLVRPFEGLVDTLTITEDSYVVIVTRGHVHDYTVLRDILRKGACYVGMIGSTRKRDVIYEQLLEEGFTRRELDAVYAPIGEPINAETPEEIAVSIAAQLIKVRGEGLPPRTKDWTV